MSTQFTNTLEFAQEMDSKDPLSGYRNQFYIPKTKDGKNTIYLCGNSLGLQPISVRELMDEELFSWQKNGVEGHFKDTKWVSYQEKIGKLSANIVGANENEVVAMNTLTVNLHLLMISFYRPTKQRYKIIIEGNAFPSDQYAVKSQIRFHDFDPSTALIELKPRKDEHLLRTEDIIDLIHKEGDTIALIMLGGVNYYTGQVYNIEAITEAGHEQGCMVGFDLAHAFGNIKLDLHAWNVDFAVWCTYKYGNGGPGAIAGAFIHENHLDQNLPRLEGWWGNNKTTRFLMEDTFDAINTAEAWQLSNPPIFSMTPLLASLQILDEVGMDALVEKSKMLTGYLEFLIIRLENNKIWITPDAEHRGCQISIHFIQDGKKIYDQLSKQGVICDWREPDVIRVAPVPLYNSFNDVYNFVRILKELLGE